MLQSRIGVLPVVIMVAAAAGTHAGAQAGRPIADTPFEQEYHEGYPLSTAAENDVRSVAVDQSGTIWAATGAGVRYLREGRWQSPSGGDNPAPAYVVRPAAGGGVWVGAWNGLYAATSERITPTALHGSPIGAIGVGSSADGIQICAGGPGGIMMLVDSTWKPVAGRWQTVVRSILPVRDGKIWIATASGLYIADTAHPGAAVAAVTRPDGILSSNVTSLVAGSREEVIVGSTGGIDRFAEGRRRSSWTGANGMPNHQVRGLAADRHGRIWAATALGLCRLDHGVWRLRHSRRWLQSDDARDVAIGPDGAVWIATAAGVDAIRSRPMTLDSKAAYFLEMLRARHIRPPGLIGPAVLAAPGDLSHSFIEDDDNDGEHTGMYLAMESMRYAVTRDPSARDNAKAAFHALVALQRATGTHHFIARSVLPTGTSPRHEVDRSYTPEEIAESLRTDPRGKIIQKRWTPTADGKWLWKRDASSDEIDGHLFGYCVYFDLAADDVERRVTADEVDRVVGGILDHGYTLHDIDGKPTQWGDWSPASLNDNPNWHEERPGNSVEIISHLGVAYHVTGNERYLRAAHDLLNKHGYDRNMLQTVFETPSERTHIEDELLSIVYPNLMSHPVTPKVVRIGQISMQRWHHSAARDHIPFYDFVFNRYSGRAVDLSRAVEQLRDWPLDMVEWTVDNSKREDIRHDWTPGLEVGMLTRMLPRSEMGLCMWDQEPYRAVIGNGGAREDKPTDWLLAYWMGRYYGLLSAPQNTAR